MPRWVFWSFIALAAAALLPWAVPVSAQTAPAPQSSPAGSGLFSTYCAVCHGANAKGTGPLADSLKRRPADLTVIARNGGGTFDKDLVKRIIDGKNPVKGHGGGDMPVWGDAFERSADAGPGAAQERIESLVDYIASIQAREN